MDDVAQQVGHDQPAEDPPEGAADGTPSEELDPIDPSVLQDNDGDGSVSLEPPAAPVQEVPGAVAPPPDAPVEEPQGPVGELAARARDVDMSDHEPGDEITELRTEFTRTFATEDGNFRTEVGTEPFFSKDASGDLVRPDPTPRRARDGRWRAEAGLSGLSFGSNARNNALGMVDFGEDRELAWSLNGAASVAGTASSDGLTYEDVLDGVDLQLSGTADSVKEVIVLQDASAPTVYEFPLKLSGLEAQLDDPLGSVRLLDPDTGEAVGVIPTALAHDSRRGEGEELEPKAMRYDLVQQGDETILRLTVDEAWLKDPARTFPVKVDPTVVPVAGSYGASGDTYIKDNGDQAVRFINEPVLRTGGGGGNHRSYLVRWNLDLLGTALILDATYQTLNIWSYSCQPRWFGVFRITSDWDPADVNYNSQPSYDENPKSTFYESNGYEPGGCGDAWMSGPMPDIVQGWVDNVFPNYGLTGRVDSWDGYNDNYTFKEFQRAQYGGQILDVVWSPYRVAYAPASPLTPPTATQPGHLAVWVANKHWVPWNNGGANPYKLGHHIWKLGANGWELYNWNGGFTNIPAGMGSAVIDVSLNPLPPGYYQFQFDMVQEGVTWFSEQSTHPDQRPLAVDVAVGNTAPFVEEASPVGRLDTRTPTLSVTGKNPDGYPTGSTLEYEFVLCEDVPLTQACQVSPWQAANTWAPPGLKWGKTYYWAARVRETGPDGVTSQRSWTAYITPTVVQPKLESHFGQDPYAPLYGGVNPAVGNFVASTTDVQIAAAGLPVDLTRTYNSMDTRVGAFGAGWSTFLDLKAQAESGQKILVSFPDGHQERYAKNPDGIYVAGLGDTSTMRDRAGGGWELVRTDRMVYAFDAPGRPVEVRDAFGNKLTLTRNAASGLVERVANQPSGRYLDLTWAADGPGGVQVIKTAKANTVTSDGQTRTPTWNYTYTSGRLSRVCSPVQSAPDCERYTYFGTGTGKAGKMQHITQPDGDDKVELDYKRNGTVDWIENGVNSRWGFSNADDKAEGTYHPIDGWSAATLSNVGDGATVSVDVTGGGGVPDTGVQAVVVDIDVQAWNDGWLEASASDSAQTGVSTSDYLGGGNWHSSLNTVRVGADGKIKISSHGSALNMFVDVVGWYAKAGTAGGSVFVPLTTKRILDTRESGQGGAIGDQQTRLVDIRGLPEIPDDGVTAVVYDLEAVEPTGTGSLTTHASGVSRPPISTVWAVQGDTFDNLQITKLGTDGKIAIFSGTGTVNVNVDIVGYFIDPAVQDGYVYRPISAQRLIETSGTPSSQWTTPWPAGSTRTVLATGIGGLPARGVAAVVGDVQAELPSAFNPMRTTPSGTTPGTSATYLAHQGEYFGNHFYVGLGDNGGFDLSSPAAATHVIVDVVGYFTPIPRTTFATDPSGNTTEYRYDELRRMTMVRDPAGFKTVHTYNAEGFLASTVESGGRERRFGYDAKGHLISDKTVQTGSSGLRVRCFAGVCPATVLWSSETHMGYVDDPANPARDGKLAWIADGRSANRDDTTYRTNYTYNPQGQLTSVMGPVLPGAPNGVGVSRTFTTATTLTDCRTAGPPNDVVPAGLVRTETDAAGLTTTSCYNAKGDLTELRHAAGLVEKFTYDELGRVLNDTEVSAAYPTGNNTAFIYDDLGRVTKKYWPIVPTAGGGGNWRMDTTTYWPNGQSRRVTSTNLTDSTSRWTEDTYNNADQLVTTTDNAGRTMGRTYDLNGNIATSTAVDGLVTAYGYNSRNLVASITAKSVVDDPIGAPGAARDIVLGTYTYDALGRRLTELDASGRLLGHYYRADGEHEATILRNFRDTDPDTGLPTATQRGVLIGASRFDAAGDPIEEIAPSNWSFVDEFAGSAFGNGWSTTGAWSIGSGVAKATAPGVALQQPYYATDGQVSEVLSADAPTALVFRAADTNNYLRVQVVAGAVPKFTLDRVVNGVATTIAERSRATPLTAGDRVEVTYIGERIWVRINSEPILDWYDATNENAKGVGIAATAANQSAASFRHDSYLVTANTFDAYGRRTSSTVDPFTNDGVSHFELKTTWSLLPDGRPERITRGAGGATSTETTQLGYDSAGRPDWSKLWLNSSGSDVATTDYIYDDRGLLTRVVSPQGAQTDRTYDQLGRLTGIIGPPRTVEHYGQAAVPNSRPTTSYGYNIFDEKTVTIDPTGRTTAVTYDGRGFPTQQTLPSYTPPGGAAIARTIQATYDAAGRQLSVTNELNRTTDFVFNSLGRQVARKDPSAGGDPRGVWRTTYDDTGRQVEVTNPSGAITRQRWNDLDRVTGTEQIVRQPSLTSYVSATSYGDAGEPTRNRSAAGVVTLSGYNLMGQRVLTRDAAGNETDYLYTTGALGRLSYVYGPDHRAVTITYNKAGDVVSEFYTGPNNNGLGQSTYVWNKDHKLLSAATPRGDGPGGFATTYQYDSAGQLIQRTTPVSSGISFSESFGYDELGHRTRYTDGRTNATWQTFNSMGLPEDTILPAAGAQTAEADRRWRTAYDASGDPLTQSVPSGITVSTTFDELGRPIAQSGTGAQAATDTRSFDYDNAGRPLSATTPAGTQTFSYDDRDLLLSSAGPAGTSSFAYDGDRRVTNRTDSSGTTSLTYDNRGLPDTMTSSLAGTASFDFDPIGRPTLVDYGAVEHTYTYDTTWGRVATDKLANGTNTLYSATYGYDSDGNVTSKAVAGTGVPNPGPNTYTYDQASRLTSWTGPSRSETYGWDNASNRTQAGATTSTFDAQNRLTSTAGTDDQSTFSWNANGTLDSQSVLRRVAVVVADPANLTPADQVISYCLANNAVYTFVDDNAAAVTSGAEVILISPSVDATALGTKYASSTVPVVDLAASTWQNSGLTNAPPASGSSATAYVQTASHPVAAGKTGTVTLLSSADTVNRATSASLGSGAVKVWAPASGSTDAVVAAYDTGAALPSGTAPARRVAIGYSAGAMAKVNADGWAVVSAAIAWADNAPDPSRLGGTNFDYDAFEQLRHTDGVGGTNNFAYDALGRRLTSPTGPLTYAGTNIDPSADGVSRFQTGPGGTVALDDMNAGGGVWGHADGHSDIVGTFGASSTALANSQSFSPWGQPLGTSGSAIPLGYQSERRDLPVALVPMGAREYNPGTGTFTSRDPVGDPRVRNGYSYTSANPMGGIDPTGEQEHDCYVERGTQLYDLGQDLPWIEVEDFPSAGCWDAISELDFGPTEQEVARWNGECRQGRRSHYFMTSIPCPAPAVSMHCQDIARMFGDDPDETCRVDQPNASYALGPLLGRGRGRGTGQPRPLSNYERFGGRPATVLPPLPHSDLFNQVIGGQTAVPNYPGRYQIDPTTGQLIDTGAAGLAHDPAAVTTVVIPDYPGSPQFIISNLAEDPDEPPDIPDPETDGDCGDESDDTTEGHDTAHGGNPSECSDSGSDDELQLEQLHLALGLTSIRTPGQPRKPNSLAAFAAEHNAKTWKQPPFNQFWRYPTPSSHQEMIDYTVMQAGRISFNLDGMLELDKVVTGQRQVGLTEKELYYICTTPAARQITTFYNGENPC